MDPILKEVDMVEFFKLYSSLPENARRDFWLLMTGYRMREQEERDGKENVS